MQADTRQWRILVVEDDPMVLELISTRLTLAGFQTFHVQERLHPAHLELRADGQRGMGTAHAAVADEGVIFRPAFFHPVEDFQLYFP